MPTVTIVGRYAGLEIGRVEDVLDDGELPDAAAAGMAQNVEWTWACEGGTGRVPPPDELLAMAARRADGWMARAKRAESILADLGVDWRTPDEVEQCNVVADVVRRLGADDLR